MQITWLSAVRQEGTGAGARGTRRQLGRDGRLRVRIRERIETGDAGGLSARQPCPCRRSTQALGAQQCQL